MLSRLQQTCGSIWRVELDALGSDLTVRFSDKAITVSTDEGSTAILGGGEGIRRMLIASLPPDADWRRGVPTAVMLGAIAEARNLKPDLSAERVPALTEATSGDCSEKVSLGEKTIALASPLDEVLARRVSGVAMGGLTIEELGTVLVAASRVRVVGDVHGGVQESFRQNPSAGARHPCSLIVLAWSVSGIARGLWRFDPFDCSLSRQCISQTGLATIRQRALEAVSGCAEAGAILFVVSNFERTLSRYPAGSTLVWRESGCLAMLTQLVATGLGLQSRMGGIAGLLTGVLDSTNIDTMFLVVGRSRDNQSD